MQEQLRKSEMSQIQGAVDEDVYEYFEMTATLKMIRF